MCPACIIAISGGLLIANKFGINNLLIIGLATIFLSMITNIVLRKINHGKVFFPYQRIIVSAVILFITILLVQFLL
ncbi:MAG: hypothetical protein WC741_01155 [Patescibacteria group bacterium]|jgi:hypothetical protein